MSEFVIDGTIGGITYEDSGSAAIATVETVGPVFVTVQSYDDESEVPDHDVVESLRGKRVRVAIEVVGDNEDYDLETSEMDTGWRSFSDGAGGEFYIRAGGPA